MIPTKFRMKIARSLAYPVGAELLTEALREVPQIEKLTVSFFYDSRSNKKSDTFSVIEGIYLNLDVTFGSPKEFIARGMYEETWELMVYAVPREQKPVVKRLLLDEGLQKLAEWMKAKRTPAWLYGRKSFTILFSSETQLFSYSEDGTP